MKTLIGPAAAAPSNSMSSRAASFSWIGKSIGVMTFVLLMIIAAQPQMKIILPDTPVPQTLQSLVAILAGATLGGRLGMVSMALYLALGTMFEPVFVRGTGALWGITGGYLVGFLICQPIVGMLTHVVSEQPRDSICRIFLAGVVGHGVVLGCGFAGMWAAFDGNATRAFELGVLPFVVSTFLKIAVLMIVGAPIHAALRTQFDPAR
jgi:biotin transport system substrate-specific component